MDTLESRKKDHIELAFKSKTAGVLRDERFHYEPLLSAHPSEDPEPFTFLGKTMLAPVWVSSMTGGTKLAGTINRNLARACREFGLGMGLGSCRILLEDNAYFDDFNMRSTIGYERPLWANLGIAQVEKLLESGQEHRATEMVKKLEADGLIIHVNPMQEWFQPEGDTLFHPPAETIERFMEKTKLPLIVKEVGQGMGPGSLRKLLDLPLEAIEFAAFGGTNFARVELLRGGPGNRSLLEPLSYVGEDALTMVETVNRLIGEKEASCRSLIISGGISTFLDGYYLISKSRMPAVYGMASAFLEHARDDYDKLQHFVSGQTEGLRMAQAYLTIK